MFYRSFVSAMTSKRLIVWTTLEKIILHFQRRYFLRTQFGNIIAMAERRPSHWHSRLAHVWDNVYVSSSRKTRSETSHPPAAATHSLGGALRTQTNWSAAVWLPCERFLSGWVMAIFSDGSSLFRDGWRTRWASAVFSTWRPFFGMWKQKRPCSVGFAVLLWITRAFPLFVLSLWVTHASIPWMVFNCIPTYCVLQCGRIRCVFDFSDTFELFGTRRILVLSKIHQHIARYVGIWTVRRILLKPFIRWTMRMYNTSVDRATCCLTRSGALNYATLGYVNCIHLFVCNGELASRFNVRVNFWYECG